MINLKEQVGKRYRVTWEESWEPDSDRPEEEFMEIVGKRGYIRPWGDSELEVYVSSIPIANRIERSYPKFKPKNHYDDAIAFVIGPESLSQACTLIKARNRRVLSPEQREQLVARLIQARSKLKKGSINSGSANDLGRNGVEPIGGVK